MVFVGDFSARGGVPIYRDEGLASGRAVAKFLFLEGVFAAFAGSDSDGVDDFGDKDFAVAEFAGLGGRHDGIDTVIQLMILDDDIEFDFRHKIEGVSAASEGAGLALLAAESAGF